MPKVYAKGNETIMTSAGEDFSTRENVFFKKKRRAFVSQEDMARNQAYADWLGVALPINEKRNVRTIEQVLTEALQDFHFKEPSITQEQLKQIWARAAGEFISTHAELIKIENKSALVKVIHPSVRFHLMQWKAPLLQKLQAELGKDIVASVKFIYG